MLISSKMTLRLAIVSNTEITTQTFVNKVGRRYKGMKSLNLDNLLNQYF